MKKLRNLFFPLIFVLLASCQRQPQDTLKFGIMGAVEAIPFIVAEERGYLDEIPLELVVFTNARERDAAMQAGTLDGMVADVVAVFLYQEAGFDLRLTGTANGTFALVGSPDPTTVALSSNTATELVLDLLELDGITKTEIPAIPLRLEMLKEGLVEAALLPEPYASLAIKAGFQNLGGTQDLGFNPFVTAFTQDAITQHKEAIASLFEAYDQAVRYLNESPLPPYQDVLSQRLGFPDTTWQAYTLPPLLFNAAPDTDHLLLTRNWLKSRNLLTGDPEPDSLLSPISFW